MKRYRKPPLSVADQIIKLAARGLELGDEQRVERYLNTIGFYRLSAYFIPFEDNSRTDIEHAFLEGTRFDDVLNLYIFDRELRLLVLEAMERIEVAARACWANALTLDTKDAHAYMDMSHFKSPQKHLRQLNRVANDLEGSKEQFIKHYRNAYSEPFLPPTWAMVETLSFGALSHWYADTKSNNVKKPVADLLGMPSVELAEKVLEALTLVRNTCAHHSRLWNRQFTKQIPYIKKLRAALVIHQHDDNEKPQLQPDRRLYNYLVVLAHMMTRIQPGTSWPKRMATHIGILKLHQQSAMGFPEGWQKLSFWQQAFGSMEGVE